MKKKTLNALLLAPMALTGLLSVQLTQAKLPAPSDEAKAKAAESAAKTAHNGKLDAYKLCLAMDRVAAGWQASNKQAGKAVAEPVATPACADPGVYTPAGAASAAGAPAAAAAPASAPATAAVAKK